MQTHSRGLTPLIPTPETSSGGPFQTDYAQLFNPLQFQSITQLDWPHQPLGGAYVEATAGGTLNLAFWRDESREDASLRATGIRCMMIMPPPLLHDAVADLLDSIRLYYRAPSLNAAPPPRETASSGTLRELRPLKIQG